MKKITFLLAMLLMTVLATNNVFAQDDDAFFKNFDGAWKFQKVEIDKSNKADAQKSKKVAEELNQKYDEGRLNLMIIENKFLFLYTSTVQGILSFADENIILTKKSGEILLKGKIYDFNEGKNMGISYTEKGVKVNLIFEK